MLPEVLDQLILSAELFSCVEERLWSSWTVPVAELFVENVDQAGAAMAESTDSYLATAVENVLASNAMANAIATRFLIFLSINYPSF